MDKDIDKFIRINLLPILFKDYDKYEMYSYDIENYAFYSRFGYLNDMMNGIYYNRIPYNSKEKLYVEIAFNRLYVYVIRDEDLKSSLLVYENSDNCWIPF